MPDDTPFAHVDPELEPILEELRSREPIFHSQRFGQNLEDFERATASDFWEVGASGRRYSREFILNMRSNEALIDADTAGWKVSEFALRRLGPDCYLLTYTLDQAGRLTRRATIWEKAGDTWRILYHQGTIVTAMQDDGVPQEPPGSQVTDESHPMRRPHLARSARTIHPSMRARLLRSP